MATSAIKPTYVVRSERVIDAEPRELWRYRELFLLLVKRDFVASYKQTVLGPLWFFIQPFLASLVYIVIFGQIAKLPSSSLPPLVYYMSGFIGWNYFANCLIQISYTFMSNGGLFKKIYFPRLILPLSQIANNLLSFAAQFLVLLAVIAFYNLSGRSVQLSLKIWALPFVLLTMAVFALGLGCMVTAATVKYRDLTILIGYTVNLWMFASLVVYPRESVPANLQWLFTINPMATLIECYRSSIFDTEHAQTQNVLAALIIITIALIGGLWCFYRAEGNFTDSV